RAGAGGGVHHHEEVDFELVEQTLGDVLIAALAEPFALIVAATQMNPDHELRWAPAQRPIDQLDIASHPDIRIEAARGEALAQRRVTQKRKRDVIELHERRT